MLGSSGMELARDLEKQAIMLRYFLKNALDFLEDRRSSVGLSAALAELQPRSALGALRRAKAVGTDDSPDGSETPEASTAAPEEGAAEASQTSTGEPEEGAAEAGGVLHCFSGDLETARRGLRLGFYLAFGGAITFRKSGAYDVARAMPPDRIVLETDCPYQTPAPCRKQSRRNEPAFVRYVAERLASEETGTFEEVVRRTSENARRLFGFR